MKCPRCGRSVYKDYYDWYCITCGIVDPDHPRRKAPEQKKRKRGKPVIIEKGIDIFFNL